MKYLLGQTHASVTNQRHGGSDPDRQRNTPAGTTLEGLTDAWLVPSDGCCKDDTEGATDYPAPVSYVPGRFLRLSPHIHDTYLWPDAAGSRRCDGAAAPLLEGTRWRDDQDACLSFNTSQRPSSLPMTRCRSSILVAVCLVVAIFGLGGLMTVI